MTPDGNLKQTSQTAYLLALRFDLLPEQYRQAARDSLRQKIEQNNYCLSTGFVGTGILCKTLTDEGMNDLAYALLLQRKNPSWLYSIDQGATTVWERWDSYKQEEGFHKHEWNMNSFNHYAYGAVAEWMYAYMGGIRPGRPGFSHIIFEPHVDNRSKDHPTLVYQPRITWARAKTHTSYGDISSEWQRMEDGQYKFTFIIPKGVTYEVRGIDSEDKVIIRVSE
jgi:alpha-L-rhamnosidase